MFVKTVNYMKTIEEYIELSKSMPNTSRAGAASYIFENDNVVLIKYSCPNKYGIARHMEEDVAAAANKKNSEGVSTPKHIAIHRVTEADNNYCYVLQELAKGKCMKDYRDGYNDIKANIAGMKWTSEIPQEHIDKAIRDLMELFNMGLELKSQNFFYDPNSGYTFIDLLGYDEKPEFKSLLEINVLSRRAQTMLTQYSVSKYNDGVTQEDINEFLNYKADLYNKMLIALESSVPEFSKYRRYVLRTLEPELLNVMRKKGYIKENLTITLEEILEFNRMIAEIIKTNLTRLEQGNTSYGNIMVNEIRIQMTSNGLLKSWKFHPLYSQLVVEGEDEYSIEMAKENVLLNNIYKKFNDKVIELAQTSKSEYVQTAYQSILKKLNKPDTGFKI